MKKYNVAVVGATGAVGQRILQQLSKRNFPIDTITFLASKRSAGKEIHFSGQTYVIKEAVPEAFDGIDFAFFSAGGSVSKALAPEAAARGAIVIDNTSAFRMDPEVPLVVPEVNRQDLKQHNGIIANPNCSTIQMVCVLEPLRKAFGLKKVIVSTYQAVSGAGAVAIDELKKQSSHFEDRIEISADILPVRSGEKHYPIAFNAIPQIDVFTDNGYTYEEMKMINETKKIMHMPELKVAATCVRLPVVAGHSESVYVETESEGVTIEQIRNILNEAEGVTVMDRPEEAIYPMPLFAEGEDDVFVGRIRHDIDDPSNLHLWIVADNLLKGAALNSIQIAEAIIEDGIR